MVNMLIANKETSKLKDLVNEIVTSNKNVRIARLTTDGEETINALENDEEIDVALIDIELPKITGLDVLMQLSENKKEKYDESIIIVVKEFQMAEEIMGEDIVYDYIIKGTKKNEMMYKINRMVKEKDLGEKRKRIIEELKYIGYNIEYVGTNYLIDTILQMYINRELMIDNLQQDIYPIVSKIYKKSIHNIKCNINRATECMYYECDSNRLKEYFGFYDDTKPTAKTVMFTVLNKIY